MHINVRRPYVYLCMCVPYEATCRIMNSQGGSRKQEFFDYLLYSTDAGDAIEYVAD